MGRLLAMILAVLAVGAGVGLLTWGISSAAMKEPIRVAEMCAGFMGTSSEVIGWGAGVLAVGVTTLVLSFMERQRPGDWDE